MLCSTGLIDNLDYEIEVDDEDAVLWWYLLAEWPTERLGPSRPGSF